MESTGNDSLLLSMNLAKSSMIKFKRKPVEIFLYKKSVVSILIAILLVTSLTGCGKKYYEYDNPWISEDGKVTLDPGGTATILYDGIDSNWNIEVLSDCGQSDLYFEYEDQNACDNSNLIWEAYATIKKGKLYLEIVDDRYTSLEGQTIILEQDEE